MNRKGAIQSGNRRTANGFSESTGVGTARLPVRSGCGSALLSRWPITEGANNIQNRLYSAVSHTTGTLYSAVDTAAEMRRENGFNG